MSIKQKLLNSISTYPKLAAFSIGLALTMAIGTAVGMLDPHQVLAYTQGNANSGSNTTG